MPYIKHYRKNPQENRLEKKEYRESKEYKKQKKISDTWDYVHKRNGRWVSSWKIKQDIIPSPNIPNSLLGRRQDKVISDMLRLKRYLPHIFSQEFTGGCALGRLIEKEENVASRKRDIVDSQREQNNGKGKSQLRAIQQVCRGISLDWSIKMGKTWTIRPYVWLCFHNVKSSTVVTGRYRKIVSSKHMKNWSNKMQDNY